MASEKPKKSVSIRPYVQTQEFGFTNAPSNLRTGALGINEVRNNTKRVPRLAKENARSYAAQGNRPFTNQLALAKLSLMTTGANMPPMTARKNSKRSKTRRLLSSYVTGGLNVSPENFNSLYNYKEFVAAHPIAMEQWGEMIAQNEAAATKAGANLEAELREGAGAARKRKARKTRKSYRK